MVAFAVTALSAALATGGVNRAIASTNVVLTPIRMSLSMSISDEFWWVTGAMNVATNSRKRNRLFVLALGAEGANRRGRDG